MTRRDVQLENERSMPEAEFDRIVERHGRRIYRLAYGLTGNHHDAEDLVQETFVKAYRGLRRFRGASGLGTWLHRIAVNTHLDHQRRKSVLKESQTMSWDEQDRGGLTPTETHPGADPQRRAESGMIQDKIESAIGRLSPMQRSVFVLRHYQDLKMREIAEVLGCTTGTVKTVLFRAVRRLRDELTSGGLSLPRGRLGARK